MKHAKRIAELQAAMKLYASWAREEEDAVAKMIIKSVLRSLAFKINRLRREDAIDADLNKFFNQ